MEQISVITELCSLLGLHV